MGQLKTDHLSEKVSQRILQFFNSRSLDKQIQAVKPLLDRDSDYWIGDTVMQRITEHKNQLPNNEFENLDQLSGIQGFGQDKLDDLADLMAKSSSQVFQEQLTADILPANFPLEHADIKFEDEETFTQIASNMTSITSEVSNAIKNIILERNNDYVLASLGVDVLNKSYADRILPEYLAPYELTTWFYAFDADNWFSYDTMLEACQQYLDGQDFNTAHRELILYRGYPTGLVLAQGGITPDNLPVVLDYEELLITIWWAKLLD